MDHTVENKHFPGVFEATPLRAPVRPWGHAPRQANPVLTQGRRGAQGRDTPPFKPTQNKGCQLSLLRTFWYQNELPKSFGSRDRILLKYGHGRGHFRIFRQYLKFVIPRKCLSYDVF